MRFTGWMAAGGVAILMGITSVALSGEAYSFSPKVFLSLTILAVNIFFFYLPFYAAYRFFKGVRPLFEREMLVALALIVVADVLFVWENLIDRNAIKSTQIQGDSIFEAAKLYHENNGRYPTEEELEATGFVMPEPVLRKAKFSLGSDGKVYFESIALMVCRRDAEGWTCHD